MIVEGRQRADDARADNIFNQRGVVVIPTSSLTVAVSPSRTSSGQDRNGYFWKEAEVNERLADVLDTNFTMIRHIADTRRVPLPTAAYMLAIDRVVKAMKVRSMYA